jgi:hypothetical protein
LLHDPFHSHSRPTPLTRLLLLLLQLEWLPQDPFSPLFPQVLQEMAIAFREWHGSAATQMVEQALSLGLIPALHSRLFCLNLGCVATTVEGSPPPSSQGVDSSSAEVSAVPARIPISRPPRPNSHDRDVMCPILAAIMDMASMLLEHVPLDRVDLVRETLQQLLSSPAALKVAVHRGLSAGVREAASTGNTAARECMAAVHSMFWQIACAVFTLTGASSGSGRVEGLRQELGDFLGLEENLPFLEPLCLPPDQGEPLVP